MVDDLNGSMSPDEAIAAGQLVMGSGSTVASTVRIIPLDDDGRSFGPVIVGDDVRIREGVILCSGVTVGSRVIIGHHCVLRRKVRIGDDCVLSHLISVQHDVIIGSRVRVSALTHLTGGTIIEDDVQIGAGVATVDDNGLEWPNPSKLEATIFRRGCRIGSGATILGGLVIGRNSLIGAGAVVVRSIPDHVVAFGNPAYVQRDRPPNFLDDN